MSKNTIAKVNVVMSARTAGFNKGLAAAKKKTTAFQASMKALKSTMLTVFGAGAAFSIMRGAIRTIADFDQSMANLKAIVQPTEKELGKLRETAKQLGRETKFTNVEVATLQTELGKLGFTAKEVINAQEAILDLAAATNTDLAQAAIVAGTTLRQFGLDAVETSRVVDVMAKSFTTSALDMDKFSESMKYVGPIANAANISLEETTAMMAALANAGIDGSMAGTSLKMIINKLTTDSKPLSEKLRELSDNGLTFAEANKEVGLRAQAALLVLEDQIDTLGDLETSFENAGGAAEEMAKIQLNTLTGKVTELTSAWSGLMTEIGGEDFGLVKGGIDGLSDILNAFTESLIAWRKLIEDTKKISPLAFGRGSERMLEAAKDPSIKPLELKVPSNIVPLAFQEIIEGFDYLNTATEEFSDNANEMIGRVTDINEVVKESSKPMKKYWEVMTDGNNVLGLSDFKLSDVSDGLRTMGDEALATQLKFESFKDGLLATIGEMPEEIFNDMDDIPVFEDTKTKAEIFKADMEDMLVEMNALAEQMVTDSIIAVSELIGAWVAGDDLKNGLLSILAMFGDFAVKMGGLMIAYGVTMAAFEAAWANPFALIGLGAALVAIGSGIKTLANKGVSGSGTTGTGTAMASMQPIQVTGTISNNTIKLSNDRGTASSNSYNGLRY